MVSGRVIVPVRMGHMTSDAPLCSLWAGADPDALALVVPDGETRLTYAELSASVTGLAGALSALGVARGARVCLALPNGPEAVELLLALASVGAAACPLNPAYTIDEFRFYLDDLGAKLDAFISEWNEIAHPFDWKSSSFDKILASVEIDLAAAA